jgi:hypothetical protein
VISDAQRFRPPRFEDRLNAVSAPIMDLAVANDFLSRDLKPSVGT